MQPKARLSPNLCCFFICVTYASHNVTVWTFYVELKGVPQSHRNYLKQESQDKKKQEFDTSAWILHSKKRKVSYIYIKILYVHIKSENNCSADGLGF